MRSKAPVAVVQAQDDPVIERTVKDVLAHVAPACRGRGAVRVRMLQRGAHLRQADVHQPGVAVGAVAFIGHPVGPHVPFFEHVDRHAFGARDPDGVCMDRTGVAVEHDIGDGLLGKDPAQAIGPVIGPPAKGDVMRPRGPEGTIPGIEPDAPDHCPGLAQHPRQATKERPMRTLQK